MASVLSTNYDADNWLQKSPLNYMEIQQKQKTIKTDNLVKISADCVCLLEHDEPFASTQSRTQNQQRGANKPGSRHISLLYSFLCITIERISVETGVTDINGKISGKSFLKP